MNPQSGQPHRLGNVQFHCCHPPLELPRRLRRVSALEQTILKLRDAWESQHPRIRGLTQLRLLDALDKTRLSAATRAKLDELRTKFPDVTLEPPKVSRAGFVGSPIASAAVAKMSDDQWVSALQKYAGVDHTDRRSIGMSGGESELARELEQHAKSNPVRFVNLASRMPRELPSGYFEAILRGITAAFPQNQAGAAFPVAIDRAAELIRIVDSLPGKPCGKDIATIIERWRKANWPEDILEIVAWYAMNHPDPASERWTKRKSADEILHDFDGPFHAGINSVRGSMAGAVAQLMFDDDSRYERLRDVVESLAHDASVAVRSCAIETLLAILDVDARLAVTWFVECVSLHEELFATPHAERFLHYAINKDYPGVRAVIQTMLKSDDVKVVAVGATKACLAALDVPAAEADAAAVRAGTMTMRKAAADVYASNAANEVVGEACRALLKPFFGDPDGDVRREAASVFRQLSDMATADQADLLEAFLRSDAPGAAAETVIRAIEDSPVQLPDQVCELVERGVRMFCGEAGDISRSGAMVASDLAKIVVRLYAQSDDAGIQSRCLTIIDEMEKYHFFGLSDELQKLDR